ncbi:hypothetical protein LEP1GSC148_4798 [Leptospira interrogans serovar Canicola str. LT1962]|nr:hypothetical protein LEP1GSC148_4798 [Leptospira interrogans serovar Canicola str. LT1962]
MFLQISYANSMKDRKITVNWLFLIIRTCPKTLKNLYDSSLEIFNKTQ